VHPISFSHLELAGGGDPFGHDVRPNSRARPTTERTSRNDFSSRSMRDTSEWSIFTASSGRRWEVADRRVAAAEVVEMYPRAEGAQAGQHAGGFLDVLARRARSPRARATPRHLETPSSCAIRRSGSSSR